MNGQTQENLIVDSADGSAMDPCEFVVFDNGGLTVDRYTVLPYFSNDQLHDSTRGLALALSSHPRGPQGVGEWLEMPAQAIKSGSLDLGKRIHWEDLPFNVREDVRFYLSEETVPPSPSFSRPRRGM